MLSINLTSLYKQYVIILIKFLFNNHMYNYLFYPKKLMCYYVILLPVFII